MSARRSVGSGRTIEGITAISVEGFKSIAGRQRIDVRPLTVLAGINSSGKSSMVQPLLLLKQTLHSIFDPGALLLDGANARFTRADQVLSRIGRRRASFTVGLEADGRYGVESNYRHGRGGSGFNVDWTRLVDGAWTTTIRSSMTPRELREAVEARLRGAARTLVSTDDATWVIQRRSRSFLVAAAMAPTVRDSAAPEDDVFLAFPVGLEPVDAAARHLREIIHVPAWRGSPQRAYPTSAVDRAFPGTFDSYVASVIAQWGHADSRHRQAEVDLGALGLTSRLHATRVDETKVELLVGRLLSDGADLVNIADVGFGVSQCLPVVVAMLTAGSGQLVYIEEPEIHLHPRAQVALAGLAVRAARRGVRVVLETHSSLLLRGIQTAVAAEEIRAEDVALHWFSRSENGTTTVLTAELGADGSFGEWPVDFDEVALAADRAYLDLS